MGKRSSIFERAHTLLMERFPKLGLLVPAFSPSEEEEESLLPFELGAAELLYVYGLGKGASHDSLRNWLREDKTRKLIFLEDDPRSLAVFLHSKRSLALLSDSQVELELLPRDRSLEEALQALAEKWPIRRLEIVPLPSRRSRRFQAIRMQLLRKTALCHALHLDRLHGYQPFENFLLNARHLPRSFYANALKGAFANTPAIVCGAGPSLQQALPLLRQAGDGTLLIAGGSTLAALSSQGVLPHFGMAIDPNLEEYRRLRNSFAFEVPLLYSTRVFPGIFQTCNGPFGYMRSGIGGLLELWIEEEIGLSKDPLLGENLPAEAISVTAICLAFAVLLGCNPILLSGIDLAYTNNRRYATGVGEESEVVFAALDAEKSAADRIIKRTSKEGRPLYTAIRWLMEARCLSHFAQKHPQISWINTTEGGLPINKIPYQPLAQALDRYCFPLRDLRRAVHEKIATSPMPSHTKTLVPQKIAALSQSLGRLIAHLEVLTGRKKGSLALAEMELVEEDAYAYLFYDINALFREEKWERFFELALKYRAVLEKVWE